MKWKHFSTPVGSFKPDEARAYIASHGEETYTLLDVRQRKEYEKARIPGAKLIPLPELTDRMGELDSKKPVIAYCAVGGRSRAASQLLSGSGFNEVYNLIGGIKAWDGQTAAGPAEMGMAHVNGDESLSEIVAISYGMEEGLRLFYEKIAEREEDVEVKKLVSNLAGIEEEHKKKLFELYVSHNQTTESIEQFEEKTVSTVMEGGFTIDEFFDKNKPAMKDVHGVLTVAMMLEAQALDLYLRYLRKIDEQKTKEILCQISNEEKAHLESLGRLMEEKA